MYRLSAIVCLEAQVNTQAERTNWTVYPSARDAHVAAREEANSTGLIQYVIKKPIGYIVTPDNAGDTNAASFAPPYDLDFAITVKDKVPRALTAVDISEAEKIAQGDPTQDFHELLAVRMYRISPSEITDQHRYAVKEEVMRIKDRSSWKGSSGETTLKILD